MEPGAAKKMLALVSTYEEEQEKKVQAMKRKKFESNLELFEEDMRPHARLLRKRRQTFGLPSQMEAENRKLVGAEGAGGGGCFRRCRAGYRRKKLSLRAKLLQYKQRITEKTQQGVAVVRGVWRLARDLFCLAMMLWFAWHYLTGKEK